MGVKWDKLIYAVRWALFVPVGIASGFLILALIILLEPFLFMFPAFYKASQFWWNFITTCGAWTAMSLVFYKINPAPDKNNKIRTAAITALILSSICLFLEVIEIISGNLTYSRLVAELAIFVGSIVYIINPKKDVI
jgi:hypothetical protein